MINKYTYDRNEVVKKTFSDIIRGFFKKNKVIEFIGKYVDWDEACLAATGYDEDNVFKKSAEAALAVKNGKAKYERDSCLFFDEIKYYELLYIIEQTINVCGKASIVDFGGGLGSMYFQHINLLNNREISWNVIEQPHFVEFGKQNLETEQIHFFYNIDEIIDTNIVILGSSLQYIEDYENILKQIFEVNPYMIFIDRTPMCDESWITVEQVHEPIYEASYPLRVFDRNNIEKIFENHDYELIGEWVPYTGIIFRQNNKKVIFESLLFRQNRG